jgi:elongator complex protein 2
VLKHSNPKGHSRMILGAAWTPLEQPTFVTAGRDKTVKIWQITDTEVKVKITIAAAAAVTAVACSGQVFNDQCLLAYGTEIGEIGIGAVAAGALDKMKVTMVSAELAPAKTINQIVWRPGRKEDEQQIAVASDDTSVRIHSVTTSRGASD